MKNWLRYQWHKLTRPETVRCGDVRVFLGKHARTSYARSLYRDTHEAEERAVVSRHLQPDDRVLEFGAGLGLVTVECCLRVGSENVVAFEANAELEPLLRRTFDLNGVAPDLRMQMVGADSGESEFFVSDRFVVSTAVGGGDGMREVRVPSSSFAEVLAEVRPTFLILDIEGAEVSLCDPSIDLSSVCRICMEVHPTVAGDEATSELIGSLLTRGFHLVLSSSHGDVLYFEREAPASVVGLAA